MTTELVPVYDASGVEIVPGLFVLDEKGRVWRLRPTGNSFRRIECMDGVEWRARRGILMEYLNGGITHLRGYHVFSVDHANMNHTDTAWRKRFYRRMWEEHKSTSEALLAQERRTYVQANLGKILADKAGHG